MDIRISQYILESGICLLVFYGVYYLLLKKETFFQLNRAYLLGTALLSLLIPIFYLSWPAEEMSAQYLDLQPQTSESIQHTPLPAFVRQWHETQPVIWEPLERARPTSILTIGQLLWLIYAIGIAIMAFRFLQKFSFLHRLIRQSKKQNENGYTLVKTKTLEASSFLGYIFWHEDQQNNPMILEHELVHIRQRHSLDLLLMEMLVIFLWFNPIIYWFRNSLKEVHEFIADQVVTQKHSAYEYACLLVQSNQERLQPQLFNTFNSFIKNRLLMLQNRPSSNWRLMKYLISMPILAALIILFALDFSKKLPEEVTQPFEAAGEMMGEVEKIQVFRLGEPASQMKAGGMEGTEYQILWGDKLCNCYPERENTPNYYKCEDLSIEKTAFLSSEPFQLLKNGQPIAVNDLMARTAETIKLESGDIQSLEIEQFDPSMPFFQAIQPGQILKFHFMTGGQKAGFFFHVLVNRSEQSINFGHSVFIGDHHILIDPLTEKGEYEVDYVTYQKMLNKPISLQINNGKTQIIQSLEVSTSGNYRLFSRHTTQNSYRLKDLVVARDIHPGNTLTLSMAYPGSTGMTVHLKIKEQAGWNREPKRLTVKLGNKPLDQTIIQLAKDEIEEYRKKELAFFYGGEKLKAGSAGMLLLSGKNRGDGNVIANQTFSGANEILSYVLDYLENGGTSIGVSGIGLENGLRYSNLNFSIIKNATYEDFRKLVPGNVLDQPVVVEKKDRKYTFLNPENMDKTKLINMSLSSVGRPILLLYGKEITRFEDKKAAIKNHRFSEEDIVTIYSPGVFPEGYSGMGELVGIIEISKKNTQGI